MKKIKLLILFILIFSNIYFSMFLGANIGKELGGKNRYVLGTEIGSYSSIIALSLNLYYPMSGTDLDLENTNFSNIKLVEIDPYLSLNLKISSSAIYVGVAPILIADLETFEFGLYSRDIFHGKIGLKTGAPITISLEAITTFNLEFLSTDIYTINLGIGLTF
ncbi:hypothetical protein SU69_07630 [Thermosipho melanesiensis]|uniref:Outer membrane protein beta-barrel domain-containing protein n=2 Tax=Thermosipho melanesiensis TaxID=46541 RepID=A6LN46_THEM4|nr:hypothetical protein [Thermosipho melanesiensis]ABR31347.1 hypothetical protein Tmel_1502 [Thermosipho melanesiensis BI429]APT74407.1 hypothetical protein BW47_07985 [Thermosipho melanesiensis]OOC36370.1 hypothetical protein SU68_07700 [Thermosipho melanesiensis]OOC37188.1 hypothetical protein SU69_07630 [Thermosipho melanesiensis]OOC37940.1 hypothetical protein SU70_07640 [Thermosipho melanesiensis]